MDVKSDWRLSPESYHLFGCKWRKLWRPKKVKEKLEKINIMKWKIRWKRLKRKGFWSFLNAAKKGKKKAESRGNYPLDLIIWRPVVTWTRAIWFGEDYNTIKNAWIGKLLGEHILRNQLWIEKGFKCEIFKT